MRLCATAGQESLPAGRQVTLPRRLTVMSIPRKSFLVNIFRSRYNIGMPQAILKQIRALLLKNKMTIAVAESCTGGLTSALLTQLSGSSKYFISGMVAYSNEMKINTLGVPAIIIAKKGAVSADVALLMAKNIKKIANANFGIGITGIAGPTGGTPDKPVGTVFVAVSGRNKTICRKFRFKGRRTTIRKKAALTSLRLFKNLL